jgi:hypothetical protein
MSFGPNPEFSWSVSRAKKFAYCPRRYYYDYYGSWKGWEIGASEECRKAYFLKKRTSLAAWAGTEIHYGISFYLEDESRSMEEILEQIRQRMRRDFKTSKQLKFMEPGREKEFGLIEHYYQHKINDGNIKDSVVAATWEHVEECLNAFANSNRNFRESIKQAKEANGKWHIEPSTTNTKDFEAMKLNQHGLGDFPIFAMPDSVFEVDGNIIIFDWKSGKPPRDRDQDSLTPQLSFYVLWAKEKLSLSQDEIDNTEAFEFYLPGEEMYGGPTRQDELETALAFARRSIKELKNVLKNPELNIGRKEDFEATPGEQKCKMCEFKIICDKQTVCEVKF